MDKPQLCHDMQELRDWCAKYQDYGPMRHCPAIRFGIGFYQIGQALAWSGLGSSGVRDVEDQSWLSCMLHMMMVGTALQIEPEAILYGPTGSIEEANGTRLSLKQLLIHLGVAQQQLVYNLHSDGSGRKSRYSPKTLEASLSLIISHCLSVTEPSRRVENIYNEMVLMTRDILTIKKAIL